MPDGLIYAYGVVSTPISEQLLSSMGNALFNYPCFDGIVVVCRHVDVATYGEVALEKLLQDAVWLEEQVRHHMWVLNVLLEHDAVVPFRFPTLYYSPATLIDAISSIRNNLTASLDRVRGCREWEIAFTIDSQQFEASVASINDDLLALDAEIARSGSGRAYLLNKKRTDILNRVVEDSFSHQIELVIAELASFGISCKPFSSIGSQQPVNCIKKACLIPEASEQAVVAQLNLQQAKLKQMGIMYTMSGPWPPFSFV